MSLWVRLAAAAGGLALVAFVEYGHLAHRLDQADVGTGDPQILSALRGRLTRVLAWTSLGTGAVVVSTAAPSVWMADPLGASVEMIGAPGLIVVGAALGCLLLGVSRGIQALSGRAGSET